MYPVGWQGGLQMGFGKAANWYNILALILDVGNALRMLLDLQNELGTLCWFFTDGCLLPLVPCAGSEDEYGK